MKGGTAALFFVVIATVFILCVHLSLARRIVRAKLWRPPRHNYNHNENDNVRDTRMRESQGGIDIDIDPRELLPQPAVRLFDDDFLPAGASCTRVGPGEFPRCAPAYWCLGRAGARKCAKRVQLGGDCSDDPDRCGAQLTCSKVTRKCVDDLYMPGMYLPYGAACGMNTYQRCQPGLWCIAAICRRLVPCGGECDGVRFLCRPGLECMNIARKRIRYCRPVRGAKYPRVLFGGQSCTPPGTNININTPNCKVGLVCVVRDGKGTCRKPQRIGDPCGGTLSDCEKGRFCGAGGRCIQKMQKGERCNASEFLICSIGLTCTSANTCA